MSRIMNSQRTSFHVHFPYITLQLLEKIRVCLGEFPEVHQAWVFGVHALDNAKPTSDIDIALSGNLDEKKMLRISSLLSQKLSISRKIGLIDYGTAEIVLKNHIDRDGVKIYDHEESFSDPHAKHKRKEIIL